MKKIIIIKDEFVSGLKSFSGHIGILFNFIFLTVAYVFGFGLSFIISGLGKNLLDEKIDRNKKTYWLEPDKSGKSKNYLKQF